jgi:S-adenosylmethionine decarboxylase
MNPYFYLKQVIGDYWNCDLDEKTMNSSDFFLKAAKDAVKISKTNIISHLEHKFDPQGYTLLMVLADSSLTLHSWPEEKFITVEIFSCSKDSDPVSGLNFLQKLFNPEKFEIKHVKRDI